MWHISWQITLPVFHFYSHIPCGMWPEPCDLWTVILYFYSHIPCGMWRKGDYTYVELSNFYSHIPCGMWRYFFALLSCPARFLLTHPVWDVTAIHDDYGAAIAFLLTHPVWDVTHIEEKIQLDVLISTHTSRVGCDMPLIASGFYFRISTHTSRVGCDVGCCYGARFWIKFLLTHPVWDVTMCIIPGDHGYTISTHTSRVGCDLFSLKLPRQHQISTHTSRVGCDSYHLKQIRWLQHFYSHIPCGMWLP